MLISGKGNRIRLEFWTHLYHGRLNLGAVLPPDIPMGQNLLHKEQSIFLPCDLAALHQTLSATIPAEVGRETGP